MQKKIGEILNWKPHDFMHELVMPCERNWGTSLSFPLLIQRQYLFASFKGGHKKQAKTKCAHTWLVNWTYNICTFLIHVSASFNVTGYDVFLFIAEEATYLKGPYHFKSASNILKYYIFYIYVDIVAALHFYAYIFPFVKFFFIKTCFLFLSCRWCLRFKFIDSDRSRLHLDWDPDENAKFGKFIVN